MSKPELVSETRLDELWEAYHRALCEGEMTSATFEVGCQRIWDEQAADFKAGARAALEELGIVEIAAERTGTCVFRGGLRNSRCNILYLRDPGASTQATDYCGGDPRPDCPRRCGAVLVRRKP